MTMRIAFVYDFPYPWHAGGIEKINKIESEALAEGNEVHFYTMRWPGMRPEFTSNGVRYHAFYPASRSSMYRHRRRSIRKAIMFALTDLRIFRSRFDVIVMDQFPYLHIPIIKLYGLLTGCKVVMRVAEVWDRDYWTRYAGSFFGPLGYCYSRVFVGCADSYIAISYDTKERLERILRVSPEKIDVFIPILDTKLIESVRGGQKRGSQTVAFVGRLIKEKRVDKWLYEFAMLAELEPKARGLIIGDGPERAYLKNLIKRLKLQGRVRLARPIKTTRGLYRAVAGCGAMLNMSEREGLSMITVESLSLGVPVVLPDYSPIPKEVKGMCTVAKEEDIPKALKSILDSERRGVPVAEEGGMGTFQTSGVNAFFKRVFAKLELDR
jgi:glycosyltransferase involved in cell wall biosynthesis